MAMDDEAMDWSTYLELDDDALLAQCEVDCYRASGPGGQKRNKTSSAVRLRHRPTSLLTIGTEDRSQHVNKRRALRRMRRAIALDVRARVVPDEYRPSDLFRACVTATGRLTISQKDPRYCCVVAELLDVLQAVGASVRDAADMLSLSTAGLVKLAKGNPHLWKKVAELRDRAGLTPLR